VSDLGRQGHTSLQGARPWLSTNSPNFGKVPARIGKPLYFAVRKVFKSLRATKIIMQECLRGQTRPYLWEEVIHGGFWRFPDWKRSPKMETGQMPSPKEKRDRFRPYTGPRRRRLMK
jgi:hypothetical protein